MKLLGKTCFFNYFSILISQLLVFIYVNLCIFSPSICMNLCSGANTGATTLTLARFFLTKFIFVFLYLNICYLKSYASLSVL